MQLIRAEKATELTGSLVEDYHTQKINCAALKVIAKKLKTIYY
jgi:hypothetical protein